MRSNWRSIIALAAGAALVGAVMQAGAQALPYGAPISTENAKKVAAAAFAEARKNNWTQAIAITDPAGVLVYYERMDGTQNAAPAVAEGKARSAALFRRNTKAFQDEVTAGGVGLRYLGLPGVVPAAGGNLLVIDGRIVGAIGVSGGTYAQDDQVAAAGAAALQ